RRHRRAADPAGIGRHRAGRLRGCGGIRGTPQAGGPRRRAGCRAAVPADRRAAGRPGVQLLQAVASALWVWLTLRLLRWRQVRIRRAATGPMKAVAPASRPFRILFLSDNFPPETNAPATRLHEHATRWVRAGHEVAVITCAPN